LLGWQSRNGREVVEHPFGSIKPWMYHTSQSIQGLIKWSQRGEWRDSFETALERHVDPACRSAGIELDELAEIIGDHWMSTLWRCAFEDIVSAGRTERNVADDYLKRRGWKESAGTRADIEACGAPA
jgi:hypothetical protein